MMSEAELQIFDAARHRTRDGKVGQGQGSRRSGNLAMRRHDAVTRLMADDPRHMGRQANRSADVAA